MVTIRPPWILATLVIAGWIIGAAGSLFVICPPSLGGFCESPTFFLAQYNLLVVNYHQYFELGSSIIVTNSIADAVFNALAILILSRFTDSSIFNSTRYFGIFLGSALLGNVLTLFEGPNSLSAGASGGIFGLYAAVFSFSWAQDKRIEGTTLGLFLIIFVTSSVVPGVNWVAHVGGSVGGFIMGPLLYRSLRPKLENYGVHAESSLISRAALGFLIFALITGTFVQFLFFAGFIQ